MATILQMPISKTFPCTKMHRCQKISLKAASVGIDDKSILVHAMALCSTGDMPLPKQMLVKIYDTIWHHLGPDSIKRWHLTSIGNPIVETRRSYDRLISTMGFPILVRWHLYIESGPRPQWIYNIFVTEQCVSYHTVATTDEARHTRPFWWAPFSLGTQICLS